MPVTDPVTRAPSCSRVRWTGPLDPPQQRSLLVAPSVIVPLHKPDTSTGGSPGALPGAVAHPRFISTRAVSSQRVIRMGCPPFQPSLPIHGADSARDSSERCGDNVSLFGRTRGLVSARLFRGSNWLSKVPSERPSRKLLRVDSLELEKQSLLSL